MAKTILIVEDDNFLQGLEATKLKKAGYNILTASSGGEALTIINGKEMLDLILLDLLLPDINGFEVLQKIRENDKLATLPIIIFSNLYEEKDLESARKLGVKEFMIKSNFTLDELSAKIKTLIGE